MIAETTAAGCAALAMMRSDRPPSGDVPQCWLCSVVMTCADRQFELRAVRVSDLEEARRHVVRTGVPYDPIPDFGVRICAGCYTTHVYGGLAKIKDRLAGIEESDEDPPEKQVDTVSDMR